MNPRMNTESDVSCVRRDSALAPQVGPEYARSPPVREREPKAAADFGLGRFEVRESRGLLGQGRPRQLPVPPDPERHPVVVDFHEDDGTGLPSTDREVFEDG